MSNSQWTTLTLDDVTAEVKDRFGGSTGRYAVYGVDRSVGLTPISKYTSEDLSRYKWLLPEMFVYNPMRLNIGSIGYCSDQHEPGLVSPDYVVFRCDRNHLEPDFLKYYILSTAWQGWTEGSGVGSVRVRIYYRELAQMPITLPPLPEQRAIAYILDTLDDKIRLNRRMNETLEAMTRALFKSWFVDLDPVRAKAEGRDPGLPKPLADMFPDSFEDSDQGEIPKGWRLDTLLAFASLNPESWSKETRPSIIEYVDLSNTKWGRIEAITSYEQEAAPSRAQRVLRPGDTIIGTVRPGNGSFALVSDNGLTGSTGFAVLRPLRAEYAEFVYLAATAAENIETLSHLADGAAYPAVRPEVVVGTQVIKPSDEVTERFSRVAGALLAKIAENDHESRTLAALRDTLLPKLISGELRVEDAERFIAEVGH